MSKCWRCGKSGFFLRLSSSGLCMSCLEEAADLAVSTLAKLKENKEERRKFCEELDNLEIQETIEKAKIAIETSPFSIWDVSVHFRKEQQDRVLRSKSVKILQYDEHKQIAETSGSKGAVYITSFSDCTCRDFKTRLLPCKHMYKLAMQYGDVEFSCLSI